MVIARQSDLAQQADGRLLGAMRVRIDPAFRDPSDGISHLADARSAAALCLACAVVGPVLVGWRRCVLPTIVLVGANLTTQLLQEFHRGERGYTLGAFALVRDAPTPSGHVTFALSLVLAIVLAAPRARRPLVAGFVAAYPASVAMSVLILGTHFPSDVAIAPIVVASWAWASATLQLPAPVRPHSRRARALGTTAIAVVGSVTVVASTTEARTFDLAPVAVVGYLAVGAVAAVCAYAVTRRSSARRS